MFHLGEVIRMVLVTKPDHCLAQWALAAITKCFTNRNGFSHSSGGWKSRIRVPVWLRSGEGSLRTLQTAAFLLSPHMAELELQGLSSSPKGTRSYWIRSHPHDHKGLISNTAMWWLELQHTNLGIWHGVGGEGRRMWGDAKMGGGQGEHTSVHRTS